MRMRFFHIPVLDAQWAETELNQFCAQHRVVDVEKRFVDQAENSFWAVCVTWLEGGEAIPKQSGAFRKKPRVDYKEVLNEDDFHLFSQLGFRFSPAQSPIGRRGSDQIIIRSCRLPASKKQGAPLVSSLHESQRDHRFSLGSPLRHGRADGGVGRPRYPHRLQKHPPEVARR